MDKGWSGLEADGYVEGMRCLWKGPEGEGSAGEETSGARKRCLGST